MGLHSLFYTLTDYQKYFANLQVASPANDISAPKGDYVTLVGDPVINPIPGSMSGNASGEAGHGFLEAYLSQSDPLQKIINNLITLLPTIESEVSQWVQDTINNEGTENYRAILKHSFDVNVVVDEEVFPFNLAGYLYRAIDTTGTQYYVKASFGGEKILSRDDANEWEAEDNQFYKLEGTDPVEYITANRVIDVLSVDHAVSGLGQYFNFETSQVDEIFGHTEWSDKIYSVKNSRTGEISEVVIWRSSNGGSIGDGHGRRSYGTTTGQWEVGDKIIILQFVDDYHH